LHEIAEIKSKLLRLLSSNPKFNGLFLRYGTAFIAQYDDNYLHNKIRIETDSPNTYILENNSVITEYEWLLPPDSPHWIFPKRFGSLEASWVGWYNPTLDACLNIEILTEYEVQPNSFEELMYNMKMGWINSSVFILISNNQLETVLKSIKKAAFDKPNWTTNYGLNGSLLGWLNPMLFEDSFGISMNGSLSDENLIVKQDSFLKVKEDLQQFISNNGYQQIKPENAIRISSIEEKPLIRKPEFNYHSSAEIFHYYEDIPSPIDPMKRKLSLIKYWEIPQSLKVVRETFLKEFIDQDPNQTEYIWDIRVAPIATKPYAKLTIPILSKLTSTTGIIDEEVPRVSNEFFEIDRKIKLFWPTARTATKDFYFTEIGILFK
jgi:hypothetical protein